MNNSRARLVVLLLANPQVLESAQTGKDRATNPDTVLALRWRDDLDLHTKGSEQAITGRKEKEAHLDAVRSEGAELLLHTIT